MLQEGLAKTLVTKGIINSKTQVLATFNKVDTSFRSLKLKDLFNVLDVVESQEGKCLFNVARVENDERYQLPTENIVEIDGMPPKDVAKAFDLNPDGSKKVMGKQRGRPRIHPINGQK